MAMLARVANHIYWMARYLERAENTARLINANGTLILDLPREARPSWVSLIAITGSVEGFNAHYPEGRENQVLRFLVTDQENPGSIMSSIQFARENARTIRDIIPRESWEQINRLYLTSRETLRGGLPPMYRNEVLAQVILGVQQIFGVLDGGMSHDEGYEFLRLGQNLERADMTTRIIDVRCQDLSPEKADLLKPFENLLWMSVLRSLTAYQMYRRHVQTQVRQDLVVHFLLSDRQFPRTLRYCLLHAKQCVGRLPGCPAALQALCPLLDYLDTADPQSLGQTQLHEFIDQVQIGLNQVHSALSSCYFGESPGLDAVA